MTNFFRILSLGAIVCAVQSVSAQEVTTKEEVALKMKIETLEKQIFEIILVTGGAETALREELAKLRAELAKVQDQFQTRFNRPNLQRTNFGWFSGFFQNQYVFSSNSAPNTEGLRSRRQRLNYNHIGDSKTMGRISVEFASGINQTTAQIRDAFIQYRPSTYLNPSGPVYTVGAQNTPLGYEIPYPSFVRTWPERALYNQVFFNGERGRGFLYQNGDNANNWYAGALNGLTVNDFEAVNNPTGPGAGTGPVVGFHAKSGPIEGGLSAFSADRPSFGNFKSVEGRNFTYLDLRYFQPNSKFDFRFEAMRGQDRLPNVSTGRRDVSGLHLTLDYLQNSKETYVLRYEQFDSNTAIGGTETSLGNVNLFGYGYVRDINPFLRLTLTHEWTNSSSYLRSYQAITARVQFRF